MQESYSEGLAIHAGPESWGAARKGFSQALTGVRAGRVLSREITSPGCRRRSTERKATSGTSSWRDVPGPRAVRDPAHARKHLTREPGAPVSTRGGWRRGSRRNEVQGRSRR